MSWQEDNALSELLGDLGHELVGGGGQMKEEHRGPKGLKVMIYGPGIQQMFRHVLIASSFFSPFNRLEAKTLFLLIVTLPKWEAEC